MKNILDLSEEENENVKNLLLEDGLIVKKSKISKYDKSFYQIETISSKFVKFILFFSFIIYALINLSGIILSIVYNSFSVASIIIQIFVCAAVLFVCTAIFRNLITDKRKKKEVIYIDGGRFIFNFNNGITATPSLFYSLPYENLQMIEFEVYGENKNYVYGRAKFIFKVSDYVAVHTINCANLTEIKDFIFSSYPVLMDKTVIDNGSDKSVAVSKDGRGVKSLLSALACSVVSALFIAVPLVLNCFNPALIISGSLFGLTAIMILISPWLYTYHLVQGLIVSCVFIIVGYCISLIFIFNSGLSFSAAIISNKYLLLMTFLGNIGLCFYVYIITMFINKLLYKIKSKHLD